MPRLTFAFALLVVLHGGCVMAVGEPDPSSAAPTVTIPLASPPASVVAASPSAAPTPDPNVRAGVPSERGLFVGSWSSDPETPPINQLHSWVLHIETADGEPVAGALVTVDGDMPAHGHGMPTQPEVTADLGGGDYRVEGMEFQMGGYWVIDVTVTANDGADTIHFGLELSE